VPTAAPTNVGQPYANTVILPLVPASCRSSSCRRCCRQSAGQRRRRDRPGRARDGDAHRHRSRHVRPDVLDPGAPAHGSVRCDHERGCARSACRRATARRSSYTPGPGYSGDDAFTYQVKDALNQTGDRHGTAHRPPRGAADLRERPGRRLPKAGAIAVVAAQGEEHRAGHQRSAHVEVDVRRGGRRRPISARRSPRRATSSASTTAPAARSRGRAPRRVASATAGHAGARRRRNSRTRAETASRTAKPRSSVRLKLRPGTGRQGEDPDPGPRRAPRPGAAAGDAAGDGAAQEQRRHVLGRGLRRACRRQNDGLQFRDKAE
jgi:hypothetical protein